MHYLPLIFIIAIGAGVVLTAVALCTKEDTQFTFGFLAALAFFTAFIFGCIWGDHSEDDEMRACRTDGAWIAKDSDYHSIESAEIRIYSDGICVVG